MTTNSIPASAIVSVTPGVISAGGTGLDLCGLFLTSNTRVPIGTVALFTSAAAVATFFGASSTEADLAETYFAGSDNSPIKPGHVLFTQYPTVAVPAYLRGGDVSALSLNALKAITGTVIVTVNGVEVTSATLDLSTAVSFSTAAALITTALGHDDASFTAAIAGTTLTVSAIASGALAVGQVIRGTGVAADTVITALGTGTGGTGTYTINNTQTVASRAMTGGQLVVTYDSTSGGFVLTGGTPGATGTISIGSGTAATALKLTAETAAVTSQGAAAGVPETAMDAVIANTQNFATFTTVFEPSTDDCVLFAEWADARNARFVYALWDTDAAPTTTNDTTSAGYRIQQANYGSTALLYAPVNGASLAAFIMGAVASIDFTRTNGRTNLTFRSSSGLPADVTSEIVAANLIANGYNFYGAYATAADGFVIFYPGSVTGDFLWLDTLVNEIWMTNAFQLALMVTLTSFPSIPYNTQGYGMIEQSLLDPIYAAVNFGAIREGVTLSQQQKSQINSAAGNADAAATVETVGWYLQVQPAAPQVRAARGSPPITFWYTDGQSIQKIALNSLEVQ